MIYGLERLRIPVGGLDVRLQGHVPVPAQGGEGFIYHNPSDPALETTFSLVLVDPVEDLHKGADQYIFGIRGVAHVTLTKCVHAGRIQIIYPPLGAIIAPAAAFDQLFFSCAVDMQSHLVSFTSKMPWRGRRLHRPEANFLPGKKFQG